MVGLYFIDHGGRAHCLYGRLTRALPCDCMRLLLRGENLFFLYINEGNKIQYGGGEVLILVILFKMYFIWLVPWWLQRGRQGRKFGKLDLDLEGPLKFYWGVMRVLLTFGVVLRKETGRKKGYRK